MTESEAYDCAIRGGFIPLYGLKWDAMWLRFWKGLENGGGLPGLPEPIQYAPAHMMWFVDFVLFAESGGSIEEYLAML